MLEKRAWVLEKFSQCCKLVSVVEWSMLVSEMILFDA